MSKHFHPLTIKEVRRETPECVSLSFHIPPELQETFQFTQGQSLTVRTFLNNEEIRRTYSICSSPLDKEWRVAVKKVEGGLFSSHANESLKAGDTLEVMPPVGRFFTTLDPANRKHYVAFAAGSGITPVLSLIKTTLATEPLSDFTLVYGNRKRSSIIFFEELEGLKNRFINRFNLIHILSRERMESTIHSGRIDAEKLQELSKLINYSTIDEYFVCGPEQMIFLVKNYLESINIPSRKIHFELFTTPGQSAASVVRKAERTETGPAAEITIKLDGRSIDFKLPVNSSFSLLDAALEQGADLPFACKGGVCCTCKAKLLEGKVEMDVHWGLEEEEIAKGYILTCQSHPLTERIVVDFDQ